MLSKKDPSCLTITIGFYISRQSENTMITKTITISTGLLVFSLFVVFGTSSQGEANAVYSTVSAGGNGTDWDKFTPQNVTINAGESVTWINPMQVAEPHTVTFVKDKEMIPPLVAPFSVPNNTELTSAIPAPNVEPTIIPDNSNPSHKLVIVDNLRASAPVAVDSALSPNSNYLAGI
ncbi:MAG: hypothetical protein L0H53_12040 [Candidatus Nitrosocosmicus sp.]|nr:hypothetical protein [Candidatus Nitrosocosmicus sp.]MDN5868258.1 hypothetical protein [Candidatus Nitrosocosmicus sp.]